MVGLLKESQYFRTIGNILHFWTNDNFEIWTNDNIQSYWTIAI